MERLSEGLLRSGRIEAKGLKLPPKGILEAPVRVLQFGEGNFLRAFVDWMLQRAFEAGVFQGRAVAVQPIPEGRAKELNASDCLFTVVARGLRGGKPCEEMELVGSLRRVVRAYGEWEEVLRTARSPDLRLIASNTTEAGIALDPNDRYEDDPPRSFPAKLTRLLHERYRALGRDGSGLVVVPCELIDRNGEALRDCVLELCGRWGLEGDFVDWVREECAFCSSLVDRIVTGFPREEAEELFERLGYRDENLVSCELFHLWAIEAPDWVAEEIPLHRAGLNVVFAEDIRPYRERKVRLLNGGHTSSVAAGYLSGLETVGEVMEDPVLGGFVRKVVLEEILPTVPGDEGSCRAFALEVLERFKNPYLRHPLLSIALNSTSKMRVRVVPPLLDHLRLRGALPRGLVFSLASFALFYRARRGEGGYFGLRDGKPYPLRDEEEHLSFMARVWEEFERGPSDLDGLVRRVLSRREIWGVDLTEVEGLPEAVGSSLRLAMEKGIRGALVELGLC